MTVRDRARMRDEFSGRWIPLDPFQQSNSPSKPGLKNIELDDNRLFNEKSAEKWNLKGIV